MTEHADIGHGFSIDMNRLPPEMVVVNCAGCRTVLRVDPQNKWKGEAVPQRVRGRIKGKPFCSGCLDVSGAGISGLAGGMATDFGTPSPWHENSQRAAEDAPGV
ncbi:hypothetical protein LCGC14_0273240 [marine sediment metagenome]|uniref:Uncharacterized protein n=1 Tax=marine sediment metagenome TaxID=412755 RepID=A0A0F9UEX9_9ZZZZ